MSLLTACDDTLFLTQTDGSIQAPIAETTTTTTPSTTSTSSSTTASPLEPIPYLARLSLDLRGVRPSADEIAAIQADPQALDGLIDDFLADPRFSERVGWIWNDRLRTAIWAGDYQRFGKWSFEEWYAVGQEPIKQVEAISAADLPITELVTADGVRMNATLAGLWGLSHPSGDDDDWTVTPYDDDRPVAGVLSSTSMWLRYNADIVNLNRLRANAIAGLFLCADFLEREGGFDFDISAESLSSLETAVTTESACLSCHATLDPLASYFWGFSAKSSDHEMERYIRYSRIDAESGTVGRPPHYYGVPGSDLTDLGAQIAADPRFTACAAETLYTGLVGHAPASLALREALADDFREDGLVLRPLAGRVVRSDAYRAEGERVLTPEQLAIALADALGIDAEISDSDGLGPLAWSIDTRVLAGGTDDTQVSERNRTPSVGMQVVLAWAARQAVPGALAADASRGTPLLRLIEDKETDEAAIRDALAQLYLRFLSAPVDPDGEEIDMLLGLWHDSEAAAGRDAAWFAVISALIRHPSAVLY